MSPSDDKIMVFFMSIIDHSLLFIVQAEVSFQKHLSIVHGDIRRQSNSIKIKTIYFYLHDYNQEVTGTKI